MGGYDPEYIREFYDAYGEREWNRLEGSLADRVNFELHRWYLREFINSGDHLLEVGAGPGRFTIELGKIGARATVADISPVQMELHRQKVAEAGCEHAVVERVLLDVGDLSRFADSTFDASLCYGGPISYLMERAGQGLDELLRVTKPGGYVLFSVMSLLGATRYLLPPILGLYPEHEIEELDEVNRTGDLHGPLSNGHRCHMFRWSELRELLRERPCTIVVASASGFLSVRNEEELGTMLEDPALWEHLLRWELDFSREPGAIDGGTHIIVVIRRDVAGE